MTENEQPMLHFEGMPQPTETPAGVEFADRSMAEKMFPSMSPEPKEKSDSEVVSDRMLYGESEQEPQAEADLENEQAESTELVEYEAGNTQQDYFNVDVDSLDMNTLDRSTANHIDGLRAGDGQTALDRIMPDLVKMGFDEAAERAYFKPLLERVAAGEDPKVLTDFAIRLLLRFSDAKEKKRQGGLL